MDTIANKIAHYKVGRKALIAFVGVSSVGAFLFAGFLLGSFTERHDLGLQERGAVTTTLKMGQSTDNPPI